MKVWKRSRSRLLSKQEISPRRTPSMQGILAGAVLAVALGAGYFAGELPLGWLRAVLHGAG